MRKRYIYVANRDDVPQVVDLLTRENSFKENHERIWIYETL